MAKQKSKEHKEKISKSMMGNTNNEKYTEDVVIDLLDKMLEFLNKEQVIEVNQKEELSAIKSLDDIEDEAVNIEELKQVKTTVSRIKKKPHLKFEALVHVGIYNSSWFSEMKEKFADNTTVTAKLKAIDMVVMINTYNSASNGTTNPLMAKANLAKYHDWKDKTESLVKTDETPQIDLSKLTNEELATYLKLASKCSTDTSGDS